MKVIGNEGGQETGRWLNNRAENSQSTLSKAGRGNGSVQRQQDPAEHSPPSMPRSTTIFNHQRHLNRRDIFKQGRAAALAEWRQLAV